MVKKPTLSNTTSLTPASSNSAGLVPPTEKVILQQAYKAFDDNATSAAMAGSATQRLSYAAQCHYATLQDADTKLASLSTCTIGSDAFKEFLRIMSVYFIGKAPKAGTMSEDTQAKSKTSRTSKTALLGRACKLAVTLAKHHVTWASFNADPKVGVYSVPATMLYNADKGELPRGRLASAKTVILNNEPCAIERPDAKNEPKLTAIRASVKQLMDSCNPKPEREGTRDDEGVEELVKSLRDTLCADDNDADSDEPVHFSAYPEETWNYLAEIAAWFDATTNHPKFKAPLAEVNKAAA